MLIALVGCHPAYAQVPLYNVSHNGTPEFSANNLTISGTTYNFTDSTPPPPVNDPNALNILIGVYTSHACARFSTSTAQDFGSTFGGTIWPYIPSTGVKITLPAHGTYYSGIVNPGQNPGILPHYIKGDAYAGSCGLSPTPGARVHVSVVPVGNGQAPVGKCDIPVAAFDGTPWVQLKFAGPDNTSHCKGQIGVPVRYKIENNGNTQITALLTFN
jgi:hypothetical protein